MFEKTSNRFIKCQDYNVKYDLINKCSQDIKKWDIYRKFDVFNLNRKQKCIITVNYTMNIIFFTMSFVLSACFCFAFFVLFIFLFYFFFLFKFGWMINLATFLLKYYATYLFFSVTNLKKKKFLLKSGLGNSVPNFNVNYSR